MDIESFRLTDDEVRVLGREQDQRIVHVGEAAALLAQVEDVADSLRSIDESEFPAGRKRSEILSRKIQDGVILARMRKQLAPHAEEGFGDHVQAVLHSATDLD